MTQPVSAGAGPFCGSELAAHDEQPVAAARAAPRRRALVEVDSESNHDRLDILAVYTVGAADQWRFLGHGAPRAAIQAAVDFLALVFRNNAIIVTPRLVHVTEAPAALDGSYLLLERLTESKAVAELRAEHEADVVHLFTGEPGSVLGYCGIAWILTGDNFKNATVEATGLTGHGVTTASCFYRHELPDEPDMPGAHSYLPRSSLTRSVTTWAPTTTL